MAFVNEKISDKDRKKYGIDESFFSWTVDRDCNAFLLSKGTDKENYHSFELYWGGCIIEINATEIGNGDPQNGIFISYKNTKLNIPSDIKDKENEIKEIFQDAVKEYGITGRKLPNSTVTVTFV